MAVVPMFDAVGADVSSLPAGQAAGYATGSGFVPWTAAQWESHPGAVRIAQSPLEPADDAVHADVLDVEGGAATAAEVPGWYRSALAAYRAGTRPGQRSPAVYCSLSAVTGVANALTAAGITAGPKLWLAEWSLTQAAATALVTGAGGPFPVVAVQYDSGDAYDTSVASSAWLAATSGPAPAPVPASTVTVTFKLPVLGQGSAGDAVRTVQGLLCARGWPVVIDGQFGPATAGALRSLQAAAKITQDGVAGAAAWPVLMGA